MSWFPIEGVPAMWGTIREGPARIILVLSLATDKIRCRWRRSSTETVTLITRMLFEEEDAGVSEDFGRSPKKS